MGIQFRHSKILFMLLISLPTYLNHLVMVALQILMILPFGGQVGDPYGYTNTGYGVYYSGYQQPFNHTYQPSGFLNFCYTRICTSSSLQPSLVLSQNFFPNSHITSMVSEPPIPSLFEVIVPQMMTRVLMCWSGARNGLAHSRGGRRMQSVVVCYNRLVWLNRELMQGLYSLRLFHLNNQFFGCDSLWGCIILCYYVLTNIKIHQLNIHRSLYPFLSRTESKPMFQNQRNLK